MRHLEWILSDSVAVDSWSSIRHEFTFPANLFINITHDPDSNLNENTLACMHLPHRAFHSPLTPLARLTSLTSNGSTVRVLTNRRTQCGVQNTWPQTDRQQGCLEISTQVAGRRFTCDTVDLRH